MRERVLTALVIVLLCAGTTTAELDLYRHLRYPSKPVPGVGRDEVEQKGGAEASGYARRTVKWWPRKGQDIVEIPEGAPLRTWTRNNGKEDPVTLTGLGQHWLASDPEKFDAHLIALRGIGTSTDIPGFLHPYTPMAVLRMEDGTQRAVAYCGPTSHMVSESDAEYIHSVWEAVYPKLYATVSQDAHVMRREKVPGGHKGQMTMKKWEEHSPRFNAIESRKDAKYPLWGKDEESVAFETPHFHLLAKPKAFGNPRKWINPKDPEAQNLYRKCVMESAENFWTYVEAAGASMPYWRLEGSNYKYVVQVRDSGYGGGGGWMHCGVGDIRPNVLGHELFHSMPNGGWDGYFLETMCDSGMHTITPGQLHTFVGNFCYPWRNVNRIAYKSSLWCFVLGDNPNWGYGIQMVLGSLASPAETTTYHTVARLGEKKGLWQNGVRGFGDFFGEYAARMVTCDFVEQLLVRCKYGTPPLSHVDPVYGHKNRYRISNAEAPRWCGYNIVRLRPVKGAKEITVDFQGIVEPTLHSDWRACIVAVDGRGKARYSPLWNKGEMVFELKDSDIRLWLTVAGTPSAFPTLEPAEPRASLAGILLTGTHAPRYPWEITLTGCKPGLPHRKQGDVVNFDDLYGMCDGGRNFWDSPVKQEVPIPLTDKEGKLAQEKLLELLLRVETATAALSQPRKDSRGRPLPWPGSTKSRLNDIGARAKFLQQSAGGHRHPNGGGFVSDIAHVAETAYVGPDAMVLHDARVEENACIKGSAVIMGPGPVISGNAKVSGKSWVFGGIELSGNARVLEAATVSTTGNTRSNPGKNRVKITGGAVIKGDAFVSLRGSDLEITDGVVIDYTPSIAFSGKGIYRHGRFYRAPHRNYKPDLSNGVDAGALYANWQFNQPKAVTLEDSYVNNNGILYGEPGFADEEEHKCIVFNGKDQYAEAPSTVADFGELTIDMLIKRGGGKGERIFDFGTGEDECFYLEVADRKGALALVAKHKGESYSIKSPEAVPQNKWVRVRIEMDGSVASIHIGGKQAVKSSFAFSPREVFIGDLPEGNFIACGRNKDNFFEGRVDHFRIYRKVHNDFDALGPVPSSLTQQQEPPEEGKKNVTWEAQQRLVYHTTANWEDRTKEEIEGKAPQKMKDWLKRVRGY